VFLWKFKSIKSNSLWGKRERRGSSVEESSILLLKLLVKERVLKTRVETEWRVRERKGERAIGRVDLGVKKTFESFEWFRKTREIESEAFPLALSL
jgi:hypothetical protein